MRLFCLLNAKEVVVPRVMQIMRVKISGFTAMFTRRTHAIVLAILLIMFVGGCTDGVREGLTSAVSHLAEAMLLSLFI